VDVCSGDEFPAKVSVQHPDGTHAYWADAERARALAARRNARVIRSRNGRVRALQLIDPAGGKYTSTGLGHWITSNNRESDDNPAGVWRHDRHLLLDVGTKRRT
jgi:hypothetical protein